MSALSLPDFGEGRVGIFLVRFACGLHPTPRSLSSGRAEAGPVGSATFPEVGEEYSAAASGLVVGQRQLQRAFAGLVETSDDLRSHALDRAAAMV